MSRLDVIQPGAIIRLKSNRIVVVLDGRVLRSIPVFQLARLIVHAGAEVTPAALRAIVDHHGSVVFLDRLGRLQAEVRSSFSDTWEDRHRQMTVLSNREECLMTSAAIVRGKIHNQRVLIGRVNRRHRYASLGPELAALKRLGIKSTSASSLDSLRGIEGAASRVYFSSLKQIIDDQAEFTKRARFGSDVVNASLNYTYALLRERVCSAIVARGLDPEVGVLHGPFRRRPALALDLMEEWRSPIADRVVLTLLSRGDIGMRSMESKNPPMLHSEARRRLVRRFVNRLSDSSGAGKTYGAQIDVQVGEYRAWLRGGPSYAPYAWR